MSMSSPTSIRTNPPLTFQPDFEQPEANEAEIITQLQETMGKIREKTYADTGHGMRSVHVKSHGLLQGTLTVLSNLPPEYAQGAFAKGGSYPVVMRLSSTPGDVLPDQVSTPRGCALKIIGVEGARLEGSTNDVTQDFVMVNGGSTFQVGTLKAFLANLKLLAATTDKGEGAKVAVSTIMQGVEKAIEALGGTSAKIRSMGGEPETHILGESFFTQAPLLFGSHIAKVCLVPVSPALTALTGMKLEAGGDPLALRNAVLDFFRQSRGAWELRAQLATDLKKMPIEDASVEWPEDTSPYVPVARIDVPSQTSWSEARSAAVDDGMSFSPWHGLADHRPLGSIMRGRKVAYEQSAKFRAARNGKSMAEPHNLDGFSS